MTIGNLFGGRFKPLTEKEIKEIHETSLFILGNVGIRLCHKKALDILSAGGACVDYNKNLVKFSADLVEKILEKVPSKITLCGRQKNNDLVLKDTIVHTGTGGAVVYVYDLRSGIRRSSVLSDIQAIACVVESLDNIDFFVIPVHPSDIPEEIVDINKFYHSFANTTKHVMSGVVSKESFLEIALLAEKIVGGRKQLLERPIFSIITNAISPLKFDDNAVDILIEVVKYGIPVTCAPAPMTGATAPMTLAGTLAQQNAESLAGIILAQMVNPGARVLYGAVPAPVDPKTMNFLFGAVEMGILNSCAVQMAHFYNIPIYASAGPSDSKLSDAQSGWEKALNILMVALAGGNYIHLAAGMLEGGLAVAYEQYIIDNDILGSIKRAVRGVEVNKDTLAASVISDVGPGGNYLMQEHTLKYMRNEIFFPKVADRNNYALWHQEGSKDIRERAKDLAWDVLGRKKHLDKEFKINDSIKNKFKIIDTNY